MRFLHGPRPRDQIMQDIREAVREGYFDEDRSDNPLKTTSVFDLLEVVAMMSPRERRSHLARLGGIRMGGTMLTEVKENGKKKGNWLSR